MLIKTVARILFFGIGFGLSYWITQPSTDGDSKVKETRPAPVRSSQKPQLTFTI
jgi:hypothetical protein